MPPQRQNHLPNFLIGAFRCVASGHPFRCGHALLPALVQFVGWFIFSFRNDHQFHAVTLIKRHNVTDWIVRLVGFTGKFYRPSRLTTDKQQTSDKYRKDRFHSNHYTGVAG